jgi:phage baseplate assembly protein W
VTQIAFPFHAGDRGRTAEASEADHVRQLIEQLVFTAPGERVMRPGLGSGLTRLVHEPAHAELSAATQMLVQGALQQWLGDIVEVHAVDVAGEESLVSVTVRYAVRSTGERRADVFRAEVPV